MFSTRSSVDMQPATDPLVAAGADDAAQLQSGEVGKKNKSKSFAARGPTAMPKFRGTGFEEYYADPPLAPDEYDEELDLYHPSLSFDERIETCIQRYRARRRLNNERTLLFNRYLAIGGIDCQPRQFTTTEGIHGSEGLTKDDVRVMTATDVVHHGAGKYSKFYALENVHMWKVDFAGVVSGYLSVSLRSLGTGSEKRLELGIDVVDNFLRYVQLHDVCAEFNDDIVKAREICAKARHELPSTRDALTLLPGQFNLACVKLFYSRPEHKAFDDGLDPLEKVPEDCDAELIFTTTVCLQQNLAGQKASHMAHNLSEIHIAKTKEVDLEISALVVPTEDVMQRYSATLSPKCAIKPTGIVVANYCNIEEGYANQPRLSRKELEARGNEAFFLDCDLMELLCVGMKLRVVLHELNCDLNFVSAVKEVHPSFYTFLPQELMMEWKEPRTNDREAPSVDNPTADEEAETFEEDKE